jgi:hypothetical protein
MGLKNACPEASPKASYALRFTPHELRRTHPDDSDVAGGYFANTWKEDLAISYYP